MAGGAQFEFQITGDREITFSNQGTMVTYDMKGPNEVLRSLYPGVSYGSEVDSIQFALGRLSAAGRLLSCAQK